MKKPIEAVVCKKCGLLVDKSRATIVSAKNWSEGSVFEEFYCFIHRPQYNRRYGNLFFKEIECTEDGTPLSGLKIPKHPTLAQKIAIWFLK